MFSPGSSCHGVSLILLPNFHGFYAALGTGVFVRTLLFGCMWGVGNVNYGLTMRYLGMSLGIGVAIGVTLVVGTLVPPLMHGQLVYLFTSRSGLLTMSGIGLALVGMAIVSWAGHQKEQRLGKRAEEFNLTKGLLLAVMCGIFSSGMSFAIDAAKPIASSGAASRRQAALCRAAQLRHHHGRRSAGEFRLLLRAPRLAQGHFPPPRLVPDSTTLVLNSSMAAAAGIMWYLQFFFYAWGAANIPAHLSYVNWMLHMSSYVLFGGIVGLALGEWRGARGKPVRLLWTGMLVIIAAANLVGLGMAS